jgi:hypothetical protein
MQKVVYLLCALTSFGCAFMLMRNFFRMGSRLLLWGGLCFGFIAASNVVLFIDLGVLPSSIDLSRYRDVLTFAGLLLLIYGLVWEAN